MDAEVNSLLNKAVERLHKEDYEAAKSLIKKALKTNSKSFDALNLMGIIEGIQNNHFEAASYFKKALNNNNNNNNNLIYFNLAKSLSEIGADLEALGYYVKATQLSPLHKEAWLNYGRSCYNLGQYENSLICFDKALSIDPDFFHALVNKAIVLAGIGDSYEALSIVERSLLLDPNSYEAISIKGRIYLNLHRHEEAINEFSKATYINPNDTESWLNLGVSLSDSKKFKDALKCFESALAIKPQSYEAMVGQTLALHELNFNDDALNIINRVLFSNPRDAKALVIKGNINISLGRSEDAILNYRKAIKINPQLIEAYVRKGILFIDLNRYNEALELFDYALQLEPKHIGANINKGVVLHSLKRYDDAIVNYKNAILLDADNSDAHYNLSCTLFCQFKFEQAWSYYEWRFTKMNHQESKYIANLKPKWDGSKSNNRVFIWAEQGLGDQILHLSILPDLEKYSNKFMVSVDSKLISLLSRSFPNITFVDRKSQIDDGLIDAQIALASLGSIFRRSVEDFPKSNNFLKPREENFVQDNQGVGREIIGVSWKSANSTRFNAKSIPPEIFSKLFANTKKIEWINLQYGSIAGDIIFYKNDKGIRVNEINGFDIYENIDDLASVINICDKIITISNVTAHVAGGMGKDVILLLPYANNKFWYWEDVCRMSLWYPSVKCFKQNTPGDWTETIDQVRRYLGFINA